MQNDGVVFPTTANDWATTTAVSEGQRTVVLSHVDFSLPDCAARMFSADSDDPARPARMFFVNAAIRQRAEHNSYISPAVGLVSEGNYESAMQTIVAEFDNQVRSFSDRLLQLLPDPAVSLSASSSGTPTTSSGQDAAQSILGNADPVSTRVTDDRVSSQDIEVPYCVVPDWCRSSFSFFFWLLLLLRYFCCWLPLLFVCYRYPYPS